MTRHTSDVEQADHNTRSQSTMATNDSNNSTSGTLAHLSDMDDFEIADGDPDIRGWHIRSVDGRKIGEVDDLLVDTGLLKVRYIGMKLENDLASDDDHRYVVLPIGSARLDDDKDQVLVQLKYDDLRTFPPYTRGSFTRKDEMSLIQRLSGSSGATPAGTGGDFYGQPAFDDRGTFEGRRAKAGLGRKDAQYITRSEEELALGKRQVKAGSVGVHKRVETEHVSKSVPVMHEEVTVERRPIAADRKLGTNAEIGDNEIRIPLMQEEVVADKRVVAKEEIVIKKHAVEGQQVVEADLRKEHVDVNRSGNVSKDPGNRSKGSAGDHRSPGSPR